MAGTMLSSPIRSMCHSFTGLLVVVSAAMAGACGAEEGGFSPEADEAISSTREALLNVAADVMYVDTSIAPPNTYALSPCPTDRALVGGGFINTYATRLTSSAPYAEPVNLGKLYRWQTTPEAANFLTSEVLCLKHPSVTRDTPHEVIADSGSIAPHSTGCAVARCPGTEVLTGGGFGNGASGSWVHASYPTPGSGDQPWEWIVCAQNDSNSSIGGVASFAICVPGAPVTMSRVVATTYFPDGSSGTAIANCPPNSVVAANGFYKAPIPNLVITESDAYGPSSAPSSSHASASFQSQTGHNGKVQAVAFCMTQ